MVTAGASVGLALTRVPDWLTSLRASFSARHSLPSGSSAPARKLAHGTPPPSTSPKSEAISVQLCLPPPAISRGKIPVLNGGCTLFRQRWRAVRRSRPDFPPETFRAQVLAD